MDHQAYAMSLQQVTGNSLDGVQVLPQCLGWCDGNDTVFLYGFHFGAVYFGLCSYSQAIELFSFSFQLDS